MMDANFCLRCKERGIGDLELGSGWGFYVEESQYLLHVAKFAKQKEVHIIRLSTLCGRTNITLFHGRTTHAA